MTLASSTPWVVPAADFGQWRDAARRLLQAGVPPAAVIWEDAREVQEDLFASAEAGAIRLPEPSVPPPPVRIAREDLALLERASRYRCGEGEQGRWALLYRVMWRLHQGERAAIHAADVDGRVLHQRHHAVKREAHHMHAFLRFYRDDTDGDEADARGAKRASGGEEFHAREDYQSVEESKASFIAWFEPAHDVLELGAEHFADRLGSNPFLIATPRGGVAWNGEQLDYRTPCPPAWAARARAAQTAGEDSEHALWRTYFVSTFNPARLNHRVMTQHMPQRFWRHLSEGDLIPELEARARHGGRRLAQEASVGERKGKTLPPARR
ncbi:MULTISPECIES: TIGR03915 family putative DNA repair protein [Salinicola]|uniref:TIGR03915 family putative DNA repair protein n=1 Tax=Salinicola TaxID=404432 RepID=UPI000DA1D280|nr:MULTISPECIES: TIGR03915 family putative DNA repair protein [Salinicola]